MLKIVNSGDGGVGKTAFLKRYTENTFNQSLNETIGTGFYAKTLFNNGDHDRIDLAIFDLAGQQRFRFFLEDFVYKAMGALLFFDLSRYETFLHIEDWIKVLRSDELQTSNLPILLIGNKCDLQDFIEVEQDEIDSVVERYNLAGYFPTSSKEMINIDESMNALIENILNVNEIFN